MKNLEQTRARNALAKASESIRDTAKKVAPMIMNNGLLAAAAFANDDRKEFKAVFDAIIAHLADSEIGRLDKASYSLPDFIRKVSDADSAMLRDSTAEALAYLNYLRRFC